MADPVCGGPIVRPTRLGAPQGRTRGAAKRAIFSFWPSRPMLSRFARVYACIYAHTPAHVVSCKRLAPGLFFRLLLFAFCRTLLSLLDVPVAAGFFFHHFDLFFSRGMHQRLPPSLPARPRASTHAPVRSCERAHACTHPESLSIREAVVASAARACIAWRVCGRAGGPARVPLVHKVASSANATLRTSAAARFWVRSADPDP